MLLFDHVGIQLPDAFIVFRPHAFRNETHLLLKSGIWNYKLKDQVVDFYQDQKSDRILNKCIVSSKLIKKHFKQVALLTFYFKE